MALPEARGVLEPELEAGQLVAGESDLDAVGEALAELEVALAIAQDQIGARVELLLAGLRLEKAIEVKVAR